MPRVLHIGNIANNAYNNAKILIEDGFECDVICYDYYHIMGCPEWEDADLCKTPSNPNNPTWGEIDLRGFVRPMWFAQGSCEVCLDYLLAKRVGNLSQQNKLWSLLKIQNGTSNTLGRRVTFFAAVRRKLDSLNKATCAVYLRADGLSAVWNKLGQLGGRFGSLGFAVIGALAPFVMCAALAIRCMSWLVNGSKKHVKSDSDQFFERAVSRLTHRFGVRFPDRSDKLVVADFASYKPLLNKWVALFEQYDVVIAYSTDVIYPMLAGNRLYIGYEHGTIRDIPFERSSIGRLTAIGYAEANVVYLTNADSIHKAKELGATKTVYGLHGFSPDRLERRLDLIKNRKFETNFSNDEDVKIFFAPARQHWQVGAPSWLKGNDLVIRAAADLLQAGVDQFLLIFVEWGAEVALSKKLINDLGLTEHVRWINPVGKDELLATYSSVDCIIDQFVLPCIGSVTLEAIAIGRAPVMTLLDDAAMETFYGATIPLLNCGSVSDIAAAMKRVIFESSEVKKVASESQKWYFEHHNGEILKEKLLEAIELALTTESVHAAI